MGKEQDMGVEPTNKQKAKSLGRVKAMQERWHSPEWADWRESRRKAMIGKKHSEERRAAIQAGLKGKKKSLEQVQKMKERKGVQTYAVPLLYRKVLTDDIISITGLERSQIKDVRAYLRKQGRLSSSPEETSELIRATRTTDRRERTPDELKINKFVGDLIKDGFITENLWYWDRLHQLYSHYKRELSSSIPQQVSLEAYFAAKLHEGVGKEGIYQAYTQIKDIHGITEGDEELFIRDKLAQASIYRRVSQ